MCPRQAEISNRQYAYIYILSNFYNMIYTYMQAEQAASKVRETVPPLEASLPRVPNPNV